jgi:hypothetical protein
MPKRDHDPRNDKPAGTGIGSAASRLAQTLFTRQVRIQRGAKGLKVVLDGPASEQASAQANPIVSDETVQTLLMHSDLTALLDGAKGSRKVLRHLAAVEHGLEHRDAGALFLFEIAPDHLRMALRQLEGLIVGSMSPGLIALRSRMLDAITAQEVRERRRELQQPISSFLVDHKLEVIDAGVTDFDQANAAWLPTLPPSATEPDLPAKPAKPGKPPR